MTSPYRLRHPNHVFPPLTPYSTPFFPSTPHYFHPIARFYNARFRDIITVCNIPRHCKCVAIQGSTDRDQNRVRGSLLPYVETFQFIKPVQSAFFEWPFSSPPNQSLNWMLPFRLYFLPFNQQPIKWWHFRMVRGKTSRFSTKFVSFFVQLCTFFYRFWALTTRL